MTLLNLVYQLTLSQRHRIPQTVNGRTTVHTTVTLPLLVQLEDAIRSSMNAPSAGSGDPATRSVLDSDALYRFLLIKNQINEWCRLHHVGPRSDPAASLRAWYVRTRTVRDFDEDWHEKVLLGWVVSIRVILDPARQWDLPDPCPACHESSWPDDDGLPMPRPLLITYRTDHPMGVLGGAMVRCRACGAEWRGLTEVRAVAWELEQTRADA